MNIETYDTEPDKLSRKAIQDGKQETLDEAVAKCISRARDTFKYITEEERND